MCDCESVCVWDKSSYSTSTIAEQAYLRHVELKCCIFTNAKVQHYPDLFWIIHKFLPSNFVAKLLAWDDGNLLAYSLVHVKVQSKSGVIFFDDDPGGLLHRFCPDATLKPKQTLVSKSVFSTSGSLQSLHMWETPFPCKQTPQTLTLASSLK